MEWHKVDLVVRLGHSSLLAYIRSVGAIVVPDRVADVRGIGVTAGIPSQVSCRSAH